MVCGQSVVYDFQFADTAVRHLETGDPQLLDSLAALPATRHLAGHNAMFDYGAPTGSPRALVKYLIAEEVDVRTLPQIVRNIDYARRHVVETDLAQRVALEYLPKGFCYDGASLFFTLGYDMGVAYGTNASVNLAHPHYLADPTEIKYYSIHELHHAGFIAIKNGEMPSLDVKTRGDMAQLMAYMTHLEGMAVYAALDIRTRQGALDSDGDYRALQDNALMKRYKAEFFDIYRHFTRHPEVEITTEDWQLFGIFARERMAYRVGALIAREIDLKHGRKKLVDTIALPSEKFLTL